MTMMMMMTERQSCYYAIR